MRKLKKGLYSVLLTAAIIGTTVLGGCGGAEEPENKTASDEIRVSTSANSGRPGLEAVSPLFEEETGIKVTTEFGDLGTDTYTSELMTQLQSGSAPDVFAAFPGTGTSSPNVGTLAGGGSLLSLEELEYAKSVKGTALEDAVVIDDTVYAACLGVQFGVIIYNEELFAEYHLEIPETWDDVMNLVSTIREVAPDKTPIAFGGGNTAISMIVASMFAVNQPEFTGEEGENTKFADSEAWKGALSTISELNDAGAYNQSASTDGSNEIVSMMVNGSAFMCIDVTSRYTAIKKADENCPIKMCSLPAENAQDTKMMIWPGTMAAVNAKTQNKENALKFMEYITSEEGNTTWIDAAGGSELPTSKLSDTSKWDEHFKPLEGLAEKTVMIPCVVWPSSGASNALGQGVAGLLSGVQSIDEVLEAMDTSWNE